MSNQQQQQQQQQLNIEKARKQANLRLLQRTCNANITDILQTATHVVLYEFINQAWNKCPVEGSLFVTRAAASPSSTSTSSSSVYYEYEVVILNRNSADNFQMKVTWDLQMQDQEPYLIFKMPQMPPSRQQQQQQQQQSANAAPQIQGIWFHSTQERLAVAKIVENVLVEVRNPQQSAAAVVPPPTPAATAYPMVEVSSVEASSSSAPPPTQDERNHLAALLSQTAVSVAAASPVPAVGGSGGKKPPPPSSATGGATTSSRSSSTGSSTGAGIALDKKSLQLALLSLIQDDRFLDLLHSQYLRVVHARSKKTQGGNNPSQQQQHNDGNA